MAYDEELAARIRAVIGRETGVALDEKRMFGGLAFLVDGHMAAAASGRSGMLLRVDPAESDALVQSPHAERMIMQGRPVEGWLRVDVTGLTDAEVSGWIAHGVARARALPPK